MCYSRQVPWLLFLIIIGISHIWVPFWKFTLTKPITETPLVFYILLEIFSPKLELRFLSMYYIWKNNCITTLTQNRRENERNSLRIVKYFAHVPWNAPVTSQKWNISTSNRALMLSVTCPALPGKARPG